MAVKAGAPKPDISTIDALKRTFLGAKSIGHSDSASGVYLSTELFPKLGIAEQIKGKMRRKIEADPVGGVVAKGAVEIGFQQISELRPVKGIDIVGKLAARNSEDHGVRRRHCCIIKADRGDQNYDPVAGVTSRLPGDRKEWPEVRRGK